jgi:hypothetical protein
MSDLRASLPVINPDVTGQQAAIKAVVAEKIIDTKVVAGLVAKSNRILSSIRTHHFPFDFFPDTINVEENRVNIIVRYFFFSSHVHSVDIKDISNVFISLTPFFAQLIIVSKTFAQNQVKIGGLYRSDAIYSRRIIEGLRQLVAQQIDTSVFTTAELIDKLQKLSTTEIVT